MTYLHLPSLLYGILTDAPPTSKGSLMSQPPTPPGSPGTAYPAAPASAVAAARNAAAGGPWRQPRRAGHAAAVRSGLDRRLVAATVDRRSGCPGRLDAATVVARCRVQCAAFYPRKDRLTRSLRGTQQ